MITIPIARAAAITRTMHAVTILAPEMSKP
jgi:hypothetical protein